MLKGYGAVCNVFTLSASPIVEPVFRSGRSNGDIINLLFSNVFFCGFFVPKSRGGALDSAEELPVKIEVISLFYMTVYLVDECLKKKDEKCAQ